MAFWSGFAQGFGEKFEQGISDRIKESKEGTKRYGDFAVRRWEAASNKYDKELEEATGALELMASLTNGNIEQAGILLKSIGGPQNAATFFPQMQKALSLGATFESIAPFTPPSSDAPARTKEQMAEHFAAFNTPQLPDEPEQSGFAKLFGIPSSSEYVKKELSGMGLGREAPTRVGEAIGTVDIQYGVLDPQAKVDFNKAKADLGATTARTALMEAQTGASKAQAAKLDAEVASMPEQQRLEHKRLTSVIRSNNATAEKVELANLVAPEVHENAMKQLHNSALRDATGNDQEQHLVFLEAHNEELNNKIGALTLPQQQGTSGGWSTSPEHQALLEKKASNDRIIAKYTANMSMDERKDKLSKINPISVFNGLLETSFGAEQIKYKKGIGEATTTAIGGEALALNRAYNNAINAFNNTYRGLGIAANRYMAGQRQTLRTGDANYVARQVAKMDSGQSGRLSVGLTPYYKQKKGKDGKVTFVRNSAGKKIPTPRSELKEGAMYQDEALTNPSDAAIRKGALPLVMPYKIWSGTGWMLPAQRNLSSAEWKEIKEIRAR